MSLEQEVANLVIATTELTDAVNIKKSVLDDTVDGVEAIRDDLQTNWGDKLATASQQAETAAIQAGIATDKASEAAGSASSASASATTATTKAQESSDSAAIATTKASEASTSATSAANSATAADTSRTQAATSATNASSSASTATTQATNASNSASMASAQATIATTKANEASTSATNAATSASNAASSATAAANSATDAEESAEQAELSAIAAQTARTEAETASAQANNSATNAADSAEDAQTSATEAAGSATIASTQAGIAATKSGEASTSATIATTQAGIATTKASEALTSEIIATEAKNDAVAARDAAILNSEVFPDEATGRAAVADGEYFKVIGSGDVAVREYQRIDASTSVLVTSYPSTELFTTIPSPNKVPISDDYGYISPSWLYRTNDVGNPGEQGYGVGICPIIPEGYSLMQGTTDFTHDNYGNYIYEDGSQMVWIPAFYYRFAHPDNPTYSQYGVNSIDTKPLHFFKDRAEAALSGYALHRAFIDGGEVQPGFMHDKYRVSNNGGVASSIKDQPPCTFSADHNPITGINGVTTTQLWGMFDAAKSRGPQFFPSSRFMRTALAYISLAHGQASTSNVHNAWFDAGNTNFPKGNNNNALGDVNDPSVSYTSDGYQNCGLTGSGIPFAKTTHNGQANGIADLNGNVYTVEPGVTCLTTTTTITGVTLSNPVVITAVGHGRDTGDIIRIINIVGTTQLNDRVYKVTVVDSDNLSLDGVDGAGMTPYTSGGSALTGKFYTTKESWKMADYTGGVTAATDHWGAVGIANTMEQIYDVWNTEYPNNGQTLRYGNAGNQVIPSGITGNDYLKSSLGFTQQGGASTSGSALFGNDYHTQYVVNHLTLRSGRYWGGTARAGVFSFNSNGARGNTYSALGVALASYLVK